MRLVQQQRGRPFAPNLIQELENPACIRADIIVAWVRASGLRHLEAGIASLLHRGGEIRAVVGVDGDNTSVEGLRGLREMADNSAGQMEVSVRHNEGGPLFHPKMFAFWRRDAVRAFIGSNNLTQSGLFQNDELTLAVEAAVPSEFAASLQAYVAEIAAAGDLTRPLDAGLLEALEERGYIHLESYLRGTLEARQRQQRVREPLFGSERRPVPVPGVPRDRLAVVAVPAAAPLPVRPDWQRLYMRLRLARRTQAQIPIAVVKEMRRRMGQEDEEGVLVLKSREGTERRISPTQPRDYRNVNTYKFEAEAVEGEPILHVYPVGSELFYEFLDSASDPLGGEILNYLEEGFADDPPTTMKTVGERAVTTWYRFD